MERTEDTEDCGLSPLDVDRLRRPHAARYSGGTGRAKHRTHVLFWRPWTHSSSRKSLPQSLVPLWVFAHKILMKNTGGKLDFSSIDFYGAELHSLRSKMVLCLEESSHVFDVAPTPINSIQQPYAEGLCENHQARQKPADYKHPVRLFWPRSKPLDLMYVEADDLLRNFPVQATLSFYDSESDTDNDEENSEGEQDSGFESE